MKWISDICITLKPLKPSNVFSVTYYILVEALKDVNISGEDDKATPTTRTTAARKLPPKKAIRRRRGGGAVVDRLPSNN